MAIIMGITICLSTIIYSGVNRTTQRALEIQRQRIEFEYRIPDPLSPHSVWYKEETFHEIRERTLIILFLLNLGIAFGTGFLGYFLAGKTLKPIEDMLNSQNRFISDAAHEMRTPLTAMKTDLEVTIRDKNLNIEESKKTLESAVFQVDKLTTFMNRLLEKSKYQSTESGLHKTTVRLEVLLEDCINKLRNLADKKQVTIELITTPVEVNADEHSIEELVNNLVDNAIKYSKPGGIVKITLSKNNKYALIEVKDSGIGISQADQEHVFEPFFMADKARTSDKKDGFGLGMAISKEIIQKHGGHITLESKLCEGSTFMIKMPL